MTTIIDRLTPRERQALDQIHARHMAADRKARRDMSSGVCWSGMGADPYPMPSIEEMVEEAKRQAAREKAYEETPAYQARQNIAEIVKAYNALAIEVEAVRSALNRSEDKPSAAAMKAADEAYETANAIMAAAISLRFHASVGVA